MLPENATGHSKKLFTLAQQWIAACPTNFYEEVAVSGSVARGTADQYSDCEIGFWVSELQPANDYKVWIETLDTDVELMREANSEDQILLEYHINGNKLGAIWQTWAKLDACADALRSDRLPDDPTDCWMLYYLIPIADAPRLEKYQTQVKHLPGIAAAQSH